MNPASFTFSSKDDLSLFGRAWISHLKQPKAIVYLVHGLGEHSGRYDHVGKALAENGYHLAGFDLRGHGLSEGPQGHTPDFNYLYDDIQIFLDESTKYLGNSLPKFLYGHNLGGNLVINFGLRNDLFVKGAIITSPAIKLTKQQPKMKVALAKYLAEKLPRFPIKYGLEKEALSRNVAIVKAYQDDVYNLDKISVNMGIGLLESGQNALENANQWNYPLLLMHGSADRITSCSTSEKFAHNAGGPVEFICWEDYYHELHNDIGSERVINKIVDWLDQSVN